MNYYNEWWDQARKQTKILTKPIYTKQLEQRIKDLEELIAKGENSQIYSTLQQEKANAKKHAKDLQKDLESLQENYDKLAEENQTKDQELNSLQNQIQVLETEK